MIAEPMRLSAALMPLDGLRARAREYVAHLAEQERPRIDVARR